MVKFQCAARCKGDEKTEHEFTAEKGEYNETYQVRCMVCNLDHDVHRSIWLHAEHVLADDLKSSRAHITRYPYFEPHSGEIVTSAEHRKETMSRMGFHEAPHGVNDRYHDETADKMRSKRQDSERRRRDIQDRIKHALR